MANQPQEISTFIERLIEEKDLGDLQSEVMEQIKEDLADRIEDRINAAILENMPPEKLEQFSALLDGASDQEIQAFCRENIADLDEVIAGTLMSFRDTYLNA